MKDRGDHDERPDGDAAAADRPWGEGDEDWGDVQIGRTRTGGSRRGR
jgi:hypothetical protein